MDAGRIIFRKTSMEISSEQNIAIIMKNNTEEINPTFSPFDKYEVNNGKPAKKAIKFNGKNPLKITKNAPHIPNITAFPISLNFILSVKFLVCDIWKKR